MDPLSGLLGQKRERDGGASAATATAAAPARPPMFGGGRNRRTGGMLAGGLGLSSSSSSTAAAAPAAPAANNTATDLLAMLGEASAQEKADAEHLRRTAAALSLRRHSASVITSLFSAGAPSYDWLNDPFLAVKSAELPILVPERALADALGRLHHPLPTLAGSLLASEAPPAPIRLHKTPDELKKERRARAAAKREAHQAKASEARAKGLGGEAQKMRMRNLETTLKDKFAEDAMGTVLAVETEIKERLTAHNEANYQRHLEALPRQMERREDRLLTKAETDVMLNIYRVFPIRERASLGMFVKFANDSRLRGFVAWIDGRDAIVVLMGGPAPMRHMHNWLTDRMQWRASANTVCNIVFSTRVHEMGRFSFHERSSSAGGAAPLTEYVEGGDGNGGDGGEEAEGGPSHAELQTVYLKELTTIAQAETFFFDVMPSKGPWPSLGFLWRSAMAAAPTADV